MHQEITARSIDSSPHALVGRILHRWFVRYNPLYLLSAVLVLVGLTLLSRGLAQDSVGGKIAVGALSELYALALIAGAGLLTRIRLPRPAVFVALIAVLYQGDLSLGTETYALLPRMGQGATVVWLVLFVAKLRALAWALKLELAFSAIAVPSFGAIGLAVIPHLSRRLDPRTLTAIIGLWAFGLFAAALWTTRSVRSRRDLDSWGATVLRRSLRASWTIWGCLAIGHVLLWTYQYNVPRAVLFPVVPLLATRWIRRETRVLACVAGVLVLVRVYMPELFQMVALMSAVVLSLHALRKPVDPKARTETPPLEDDYRAACVEPIDRAPATLFERSESPAMARQLAWAGYALYLSAWTLSWPGGAWPAHVVVLDLVLTAAISVFVWKLRSRIVVLPLFATYLHWSIQSRLLRAPHSIVQWGATTVAVGFGLLLTSVLTSWRLERRTDETRVEL